MLKLIIIHIFDSWNIKSHFNHTQILFYVKEKTNKQQQQQQQQQKKTHRIYVS